MCGRYYIDSDAIDEAGIFTNRKYSINLNRTARDIYPSQYAPILARESDISPDDAESALQIREMRWGFPQYTGKGLFINARSETAMERKTFRESVLLRRCVVNRYEWALAPTREIVRAQSPRHIL